MIITETVIIDGREFTHNYSNAGRYVVREGIEYEEAYDPAELGRTYTEGREIEHEEGTEEEYAEAGRILLGEQNE